MKFKYRRFSFLSRKKWSSFVSLVCVLGLFTIFGNTLLVIHYQKLHNVKIGYTFKSIASVLTAKVNVSAINEARKQEFLRVMYTNISTSIHGIKLSKEFPGMPNPCIKPRRKTGVEDLLCTKPPTFLRGYKNPCYMDGKVFRCLPYFYLFGVCKSGTTDLFKRLYLHPDIVPNKGAAGGKEVFYWTINRLNTASRRRPMSLRDFSNKFNASAIQNRYDTHGYHDAITGHGDPYDFWEKYKEINIPQNDPYADEMLWTTPHMVHHVNPDVKLLLMLRDPVERLYSYYCFQETKQASVDSFHNAVVKAVPLWKMCVHFNTPRACVYNKTLKELTRKAPIVTSMYSILLQEWLNVFPREQIFIFRTEDFSKNISRTMQQLFSFLKVSQPQPDTLELIRKQAHFRQTNTKKRIGGMRNDTRQLLVDLYIPYVQQLASMLNDDKFLYKDGSFGS